MTLPNSQFVSNQADTDYLFEEPHVCVESASPRLVRKSLTTSLLSVMLLGSLWSVSPSDQNPSQSIGKEMHEALAAFVVRSTKPKQLSLFSDSLLVSPSEFGQQLQGATQNPLLVQAGLLNPEVQIVNVTLSQSNQDSTNDLLHLGSSNRGLNKDNASSSPKKESVVYQQHTETDSNISASVTRKELSRDVQGIDISYAALPKTEALPQRSLTERHSRLPLDFLLGPKGPELSERVCARLVQLEAHEPNTSLRSDYRQAFICVSLASKGNTEPFLSSSYAVHGIHQDKVWPRIVNNRKERLGKLYYQFFFSNDMPRPDVKWDETPIYDLPTLAASSPHSTSAAKSEDGTSSSGPIKPSSLPSIQEKERLA